MIATTTDIISEVKYILEEGFKAFVNADINAVSELYTEDAILAIGQDVMQGNTTLTGFYQQFFDTFKIVENYPMETEFQVVSEDSVTVYAHEKIIMEPKIDGVPNVDTELMVTFVWRREANGWKCCYEQASLFTPLF